MDGHAPAGALPSDFHSVSDVTFYAGPWRVIFPCDSRIQNLGDGIRHGRIFQRHENALSCIAVTGDMGWQLQTADNLGDAARDIVRGGLLAVDAAFSIIFL